MGIVWYSTYSTSRLIALSPHRLRLCYCTICTIIPIHRRSRPPIHIHAIHPPLTIHHPHRNHQPSHPSTHTYPPTAPAPVIFHTLQPNLHTTRDEREKKSYMLHIVCIYSSSPCTSCDIHWSIFHRQTKIRNQLCVVARRTESSAYITCIHTYLHAVDQTNEYKKKHSILGQIPQKN